MANNGHNSGKLEAFIDRAIGLVSPRAAARRLAYRRAAEILNSGSYKGADRGRNKATWWPGGGSPDADIMDDLPVLRERSRDLIRNDGNAAGIVSTIVANVIGTGIKPQSRIDAEESGMSPDAARAFQDAAEREWQRWITQADAAQRLDFYGLQGQAFRQIIENGEVISLIPVIDAAPRCQLIESDRLGSSLYAPSGSMPAKDAIDRMTGVERGAYGEPTAYWIRKTHPGDMYVRAISLDPNAFERVTPFDEFGRRRVIHLYRQDRPGQTRGTPWLAPVLALFKDMSEYLEAELTAARAVACIALFVRKIDPLGAASGAFDVLGDNRADGSERRLETLEPGMIEYLGAGEDISTFAPQRPGGQFDMFMMRIMRAIAAGVCLSYECVARDWRGVNYSNARMLALEDRKLFHGFQRWFSTAFCQPFWDWVIEGGYLAGRLPVTDFYGRRAALLRARWIPDGWEWVDPEKEVQASILAINNGLTTLSEELASRGRDFDETVEQRKYERAELKAADLYQEPPAPGGFPNKSQAGTPPDDTPEPAGNGQRGNGANA